MQNIEKSVRSKLKIKSMLRQYASQILSSNFVRKNPIAYNLYNEHVNLASPRLADKLFFLFQ